MKQKTIGTLLPLSALNRPDFSAGRDFLEWLQKTHQTAWQMLPLHETQLEKGSTTKHVPSPYKSYGIGLDSRYQSAGYKTAPGQARYSIVPGSARGVGSLERFVEKHKEWIHDYVLFCALRDHFGTDDWRMWGASLVNRETKTIAAWTDKKRKEIDFYINLQWQLHESYNTLHEQAQTMGISLIGDLPFYLSVQSPLVWSHQKVFQLDGLGDMPHVSGIPNTAGAHFGRQVWGHPLYNWDKNEKLVTAFWKMRLSYLSSIFDYMRFDHAKAFFSYGVMDIVHPENDRYVEGPGREVFKTLIAFSQKQGLHIFVEDSGDRTEEVRKVLEEIGVAGLRIFRFSIKGDELHARYADVSAYPENSVAYTTTHDTETLLGYVQTLTEKQKQILSNACGIGSVTDIKQFARAIRNAVIASPARMVIIPIQDWLLTTDRINIPGTEKEVGDTNWQFKLGCEVDELPIIVD